MNEENLNRHSPFLLLGIQIRLKKADCGDRFQGTGNLDKQIADPALGTSLSIGSDNRTGKRRDLHKYQAVSAGAVSGPGYFGKRPGKGGQ